jgi:hypothetical protein
MIVIFCSNGYRNFEKQSRYLNELLAPVKEDWMSAEMEQYVFPCVDSMCVNRGWSV